MIHSILPAAAMAVLASALVETACPIPCEAMLKTRKTLKKGNKKTGVDYLVRKQVTPCYI